MYILKFLQGNFIEICFLFFQITFKFINKKVMKEKSITRNLAVNIVKRISNSF